MSEAWRLLLLLLYLSKPLPGNLGQIQLPPATTDKMLLHVNLICIPTLNLFQLSHPYVYQGKKAEQGKREAAECLFSNYCTSHFNFHFMLPSSPTPPKRFQNLPPTILLLFICFRSLLTLQTHPWECFPFVKTSDLKQQQTACHLLIHQHFCCCFINDSGWNSDLLGWLMAEPHGKWIDNDLGEQRHPSDQERIDWFDGRDLKQGDVFLRFLHFWGSAGEEGQKLTAVLSSDSWGFHAQRWEKKDSVST